MALLNDDDVPFARRDCHREVCVVYECSWPGAFMTHDQIGLILQAQRAGDTHVSG